MGRLNCLWLAIALTVTGPAQAVAPGPVALALTVRNLAAHAVDSGDAIAALAAARIASRLTAEDRTAAGDRPALLPGAADLFALARDLAAGDPALLAVIEDAEIERGRGRMGGIIKRRGRLDAGAADKVDIAFYGGRLAEVAVVAGGQAVLRITVTDTEGRTVCAADNVVDQHYCPFTPDGDGTYAVSVVNTGPGTDVYTLLTN